MPMISVIMSVYNAEKYLEESVQSILNQTYTDFEFIIVNDASTDHSLEVLESFKDERIVIINNPVNIGLTKSLNIALKKSKGKYIARMDSDDICMPNRFKLQLEFMMKNPSIGVCGSDVMMISESGKHLYNLKLPKNDNDIKTMLILGNQIVHPSVIIRKSVLDNNKITYDESFKTCQDYKLWSDLIDKTQFNNLSDQLLKYRIVNSGITSIQQKKRNEKKNIIYSIYQSLNKNGRLMLDDEQLQILSEFSTRFDKITNTDIKRSIIDIYSSLIKEYKYRHMDYKSFCNKFSELWVWHDGIKTWNNSTLLLNCKGIIMNMKVNFIIAKMKLLS